MTGAVLSSWHYLADEFAISSQAFYKAVEGAVAERKLPEVEIERVRFKEGTILSAEREYLRIRRRGVVFDISAAPYGTGYFFSWWTVQVGPKHAGKLVAGFFALALAIFTLLLVLSEDGGCAFFTFGPILLPMLFLVVGYLTRYDYLPIEDYLLTIPIVGRLYVWVFRPVTYYRYDTATMFQESIRRAVNETIDDLFQTQGLRALAPTDKEFASTRPSR